jgi:hypothetical protein
MRPTLPLALRGEDADEVGVAHRRQRVVLHAALVQQVVAHEEVALEDRAAIGGEGGAGEAEAAAQPLRQRLADRADIAGGGAVEGGADLEQDLSGAGGQQRLAGGEGLRHRLAAGMVRDFSATTTASLSGTTSGTPITWTARIPCRTRVEARSVAPVKSSAMQPSRGILGPPVEAPA